MAGRRLTSDEQARWAEVARTVRLMQGKSVPDVVVEPLAPAPVAMPKAKGAIPRAAPQPWTVPKPRAPVPMLDNSWEKRVRGGTLSPEMSIDLHGHTLPTAHMQLNRALSTALLNEVRTLLVVTGKPRKKLDNPLQSQRGAIRAEIGHWLQTSPYADAIASVRVAHPRHGGDGALYVILRRKK